MKHHDLAKHLFKPLPTLGTILFAVCLLGGMYLLNQELQKRIRFNEQQMEHWQRPLDQAKLTHDHVHSLQELKAGDVSQFKSGFSTLAKSRKELFETGLSLQEERRLLDKQLEIMTTYLIVNPSLQRVLLMRGDQPMQSFLLAYFPLRAFGGAPEQLPATVRIISKERFAHPERGKSENLNGKLTYEPPQVGTSVRSNALGEFVIFTNSKLILHGPPLNSENHETFPHICLGLDLNAARTLYRNTFIGTRVIVNSPVSASSPSIP